MFYFFLIQDSTHKRHCYVCYVMLCYVMLCYVMLCYVMLCYVMLCYVMLCYVLCFKTPLAAVCNIYSSIKIKQTP